MEQVSLTVHPLRSVYVFRAAGIELEVEFLSPLIPEDIDRLTEPVTYLTLTAKATDGKPHTVETWFDVTAEIAVNDSGQSVLGGGLRLDGLHGGFLRAADPKVLGRSGDDLRIEWGAFYLAGDGEVRVTDADSGRSGFVAGQFPKSDSTDFPRPVQSGWPCLASHVEFGDVSSPVSKTILLAFDEEKTVQYFGRNLPPYWKRAGRSAGALLADAFRGANNLRKQAAEYDAKVESELEARGGVAFREIGALAWRQAISAHTIAQDIDGTLLMFSKENFSNGCIGTVDVTYPGAPIYLWKNPKLLRAQVEPLLAYAASPKWKFPFAPHDLGQYPLANGQVYGGGEQSEDNQMPVEECGNLLVLVAALNDKELATKYGPTLKKWVGYLMEKGVDPENQLCTDDFAGHLARNANLSLKAIVGVGAYGKMVGDAKALTWAKESAKRWLTLADFTKGKATRLAFDREGSWSQKYNLVWDQILGLGLFSQDLAESEMGWYVKHQNSFGLPLDNRADYTKLDWVVWTATMAKDRADFEGLIQPIRKFLNESPSRVPMTDWYDTKTGKMVGFQARSVVGGVFLPMLKNRS
jgi:hypothetical protein